MTNEQKHSVDRLRTEGLGYKKIASILQLPESTVKSHIRRSSSVGSRPIHSAPTDTDFPASVVLCPQCGEPVTQTPGRKKRRFCSDRCRQLWWNRHLDAVTRKAFYHYICSVCGKTYSAYGKKNRKYCSRICYIEGRFPNAGGAAFEGRAE